MSDREKLNVLWKIEELRDHNTHSRYLSTQNSLTEILFEYNIIVHHTNENEKYNELKRKLKEDEKKKELVQNYISENMCRVLRIENDIWKLFD